MTSQAVKTMFLGAALAAFLLPAAAQSTTDNSSSTGAAASSTTGQAQGSTTGSTPSTPPSTEKQSVSERKKDQQGRIAEGMENGSLTPREAKRLEKREAALNKETREMRAANGGKLTAADKAKLERQENHISQSIRGQKHDAQTMRAAENPETHVGTRKDNQQQRIAEGVESGRLSPKEAAQLEKQQKHIRHQTAEMREDNGGKLTTADKEKIQHMQSRASRRIHAEKHDKR